MLICTVKEDLKQWDNWEIIKMFLSQIRNTLTLLQVFSFFSSLSRLYFLQVFFIKR